MSIVSMSRAKVRFSEIQNVKTRYYVLFVHCEFDNLVGRTNSLGLLSGFVTNIAGQYTIG